MSSSKRPISESPTSSPPTSEPPPKKQNAFQALMSASRHTTTTVSKSITNPSRLHNPFRDALNSYILNPTSYPPSILISHSSTFVTIRDKFPKSSIHLLLLPRDASLNLQHPLTLLSSPSHRDFLSALRSEAAKLRTLVAAELKRQYGGSQKWWAKEGNVLIGVHARPSMNHLHVHVMSADRVGAGMKNAKHYQTFSTGFFVRLEEFPLEEGDARLGSGWTEEVLKGELVCWRCGKEWGRRWKQFREHLEVEAEGWRKEGAGVVDEDDDDQKEKRRRLMGKLKEEEVVVVEKGKDGGKEKQDKNEPIKTFVGKDEEENSGSETE